nr:ras-related protein Rab-34 [Anser cygnoides]
MGTAGVEDLGTAGLGDAVMAGLGDLGTGRRGDPGKTGPGDMGTAGVGDAGTVGLGDRMTWGPREIGTWGHEENRVWGHGRSAAPCSVSPQASRRPSARPRSVRLPNPSRWPQGTMNVLAPVRRDRVIADLPQCFRKEAALHARPAFHPSVASACQEQRTGTVG